MIQERTVDREVFEAPGHGLADTGVSLHCPACHGLAVIHPDVTSFCCRGCGTDNLFCRCKDCGAAAVVSLPHAQPLTKWDCPACQSHNAPPLFGRMPLLSARDVQRSAEVRSRLGERQRTLTLIDLEVLASTRPELPTGTTCSLTMLDHGIDIRRPDRPVGVTLLYRELDAVEISGREDTSSRRARAGRIRAGAPLVSLAGDRDHGDDAVVRLRSGEDRLVLAHATLTRDELRSALATMLNRWEDARRRVSPVAHRQRTWMFGPAVAAGSGPSRFSTV